VLSDCWPSESEELLLLAAFAEGDRARDAWRRWRGDASRTVPGWLLAEAMAWRGSVRIGDGLPGQQERLAGRLGDGLASALDVLETSGIEAMLLKGAALVTTIERARGRPMSDVDVLVRRDLAIAAIDGLRRAGWSLAAGSDAGDDLRWYDAISLTHRNGARLDLHQRVLADRPGARGADFWSRSKPVRFRGRACHVPCPEDLLLHVLAHGMTWSMGRDCRWAADAAMLLGGELDLAGTLRSARCSGVAPMVRAGLVYLRDSIGLGVPDSVGDLVGSSFEERAFEAGTLCDGRRSVADAAVLLEQRFRSVRQHGGCSFRPIGYFQILERDWGLSGATSLPGAAIPRMWQRVQRRRAEVGRP